VLEGFRLWARGQATRSTDPWSEAQRLYRDAFGDSMGEEAIIALARFIAVLGQCARCPLHTFPAASGFVSRHETLVLGLVAGIQNADEAAVGYCLDRLCCRSRCEEVASAAAVFALTMRACGETMRPIPVPALERLLGGVPGEGGYRAGGATVH